MELDYYPRSQPSFPEKKALKDIEQPETGVSIVPVTASLEVGNLDPAKTTRWWNLVHNSTNHWHQLLTKALAKTLAAQLESSVKVLREIPDPFAVESFEREIAQQQSLEQLASKLCLLKRIHLTNGDGQLICCYGYLCSWDRDHEVDLVFDNETFVGSKVGR
jgi:hypothetical protein